MNRLVYFAQRALKGMRQAVFVNVVTVLTIAIAFFVVAMFGGAVGQARDVIRSWGDELSVTLYLEPGLERAQVAELLEQVQVLAGEGAHLEHVAAVDALVQLRESLGEHGGVLDGLDSNPLPESIEVQGGARLAGAGAVGAFAERAAALPGVDEVDWGREWAARLERVLDLLSFAAAVLGILVLAAAAVTVSNTIKLALYARRDEIEIMKLCGATDGFIRAPFLIEGGLQGLLGAGVAGLLAAAAWALLVPQAEAALVEGLAMHVELSFPLGLWGWLLPAGAVLGLTGSAFSLGRFLDV